MAEEKAKDCGEDEDDYIIAMQIGEPKPSDRGTAPPRKVGLDMKGIDTELADESAFGVQEQVTFDLPDGSQASEYFKLGQTIELLKSYVASEFSIVMEDQRLYLGDDLMLDPLTLLDYPESLEADELYIRVEGPMEDRARK